MNANKADKKKAKLQKQSTESEPRLGQVSIKTIQLRCQPDKGQVVAEGTPIEGGKNTGSQLVPV